jgi:Zn-dependent peptidase ImmA (M78 family)
MRLDIPHLSYKQIGLIADQFLSQHHQSFTLPIPIEEIVESKMRLKICEQINLKKDYDVEGFLTSDLTTIFIDLNIYINFENRARFTIAHEIGHLILHGKLFKELKINSINDLYKLSANISDEDYRWLEYQAYSFASHVLVPKQLLLQELKRKIGKIPQQESPEIIAPIAQDLLNIFQVSGEVMLRRLQKEEIVKINS